MDVETGTRRLAFRVSDDAELPTLDELDGVAREEVAQMEAVPPESFETTYFDTANLALTAAGIMLLHRTGSGGGWRLELPGPQGETVVLDGGGGRRDTVPAPLRDALRLHTRGGRLARIGRTCTERRRYELRDGADAAVAWLHDDRVTDLAATPAESGAPLAWHEWVMEPADGTAEIAERVTRVLESAGAAPVERRAGVARLLGDRMPPLPEAAGPQVRKKTSAAEVVGALLREQLAELEHWDVLTRSDAPDSIHKLRVAIRRMRSALATFRPLLDRLQTDPVRKELKSIAGLLGDARDLEVSQEHLAEAITQQPDEVVIGPVPQHIDRELSTEFRAARDRAVAAMTTKRYFAMVDRLRALVADPPWTQDAEKRARKLLRSRVAADYTRLRKRVRAADADADPDERATRLHDVRKAAKRVRYAAEALIPVHGTDAERFAAAVERVQDVLGDHHDLVTLLPRIRQLGVQAHLDENAFSYGRLHGQEQARIAELEAEYRDAWKAASRKKLRRWLK